MNQDITKKTATLLTTRDYVT